MEFKKKKKMGKHMIQHTKKREGWKILRKLKHQLLWKVVFMESLYGEHTYFDCEEEGKKKNKKYI